MTHTLAAVDLGASSGRVVVARVGPRELELTEVHRFRNGPVRLPDGLYWDVLGLYTDVLHGLRTAIREHGPLDGLAVDSWAVDYGLLDAHGTLRANPRHHRDPRTAAVLDAVHRTVPAERLYAVNGLQFLPFTTLYQFAAEPDLAHSRALLIPDLLGYWLTGRQVAEETNASTTGLLDARTGEWSAPLLHDLGLPAGLLPEVVPAGQVLGGLTGDVRAELGDARDTAGTVLSTVGSHDTASAVLAVPAGTPRFGYISCGTWALVGVELAEPVCTEESRAANFTNERGVDGTVRYLRNVMGLWLLSESIRDWRLRGLDADLDDLLRAAAARPAGGPVFDPADPVFLPPGDMPARVRTACRENGTPLPSEAPEVLVRCIVDSLAAAFAATIEQAEELSGRAVEVVHLVGGGARNALLCRLTADALGRPVIAGPVEATALGNLLVQGRTHGALDGDIWALRAHARRVAGTRRYDPGG